MRIRIERFLVVLVCLGVLSACGQPAPAAALSQASTATPARQVRAILVPSPTVSLSKLKQVGLSLGDLPSGFMALDEASQAQLGLTPASLAQSFTDLFRQAEPVHSFAFYNPDEQHFEIVFGIIFYPLTVSEQNGFDRTVSMPVDAVKNFSQGFGGHALLAPELGHLGNASVGWSFVNESDPPTMQGQMFIARRGGVVFLLMTLFSTGENPPANLADLGQVLDAHVKAGLGETQ